MTIPWKEGGRGEGGIYTYKIYRWPPPVCGCRGRGLFLSCALGGTWDHLFLSFAGWPRVYIVSSHHLSCSRRVSRSDQSCFDASGPRSSLVMWFSIAELMVKFCLHRRLEPICMVDSAFLHPYTLFSSSSFSTWFPYVHAPRGWSLSQCEPCWGWCHGVYPWWWWLLLLL